MPDNFSSTINSDVLKKYQKALNESKIQDIESLLVNDIKLTADGGKKVKVVKATEVGKTATATLLAYVQQQFLSDKTFSFHNFNHQPAICFWQNDKLYNCQILSIDNQGQIQQIYSIVDPVKLKNLL